MNDREGTPEAAGASEGETAFVRHTAVMSIGTALSRITGFLRLAAMAYVLGIKTVRADAYNVANNTPNIVYELVLGGVLTSVFVPVFVEWLQERGREKAREAARAVATITFLVLAILTVVTVLAAPLIVAVYATNVPDTPEGNAQRELATFFLRWFMPQMLFYGLGAVAIGLLNAHRRFAAAMFAPVLNNLMVIGTFLVVAALPDPRGGSLTGLTTTQQYVLAIGTTLGVVGMTVVLWPSLRRTGFRFGWRPSLRHEAVRRIAGLARWVFLYVLANQIGLLVVIVLTTGETSYTAYASAFILFQLPHAIFAVSIMTALLPSLSSSWADDDRGSFRDMLSRGMRSTAFIVLPAAAGYIALARPITRLLLQHGATGAEGADLVADVLVFFAVGLLSFSSFQLLLRAFYAMQDTRTPALINLGAIVVNVAVNLALFGALGVRGLALGHACSYTFAAAVALLVMRRRLGRLHGRAIARGVAKVAVGAVATGAAALAVSWSVGRALGTASLGPQTLQVLAAVVAGIAAFVAVARALRMEELDVVMAAFRARLHR